MRELTFLGPRHLEWREVPAPVLEGPGQALVRPVAATTCDLDRWLIAGGVAPVAGPFPLGHEFVAEVVEVGEGVRRVVPGTRVAVLAATAPESRTNPITTASTRYITEGRAGGEGGGSSVRPSLRSRSVTNIWPVSVPAEGLGVGMGADS
ncbi:MAG: alcohol dehydrogenase catalytic domain-containing protein [Candidatus Dormibacteria bacterium]